MSRLIDADALFCDTMTPIIELTYKQMQMEQEKHIMRAVAAVDIHVDKERLIKALTDARAFYGEGYADAIKNAVPVVHGRWNTWFISDDKKKIMAECNECEAVFKLETFDFGLCYNYCPNCGARMDLEVDGDES